MKKLAVPILGLLGVFMTGCFSGDDDYFYPRVDIYDAFTFENEGTYKVGDTIFFDLSFSRYLEEDGYDNKLDIYETSSAEKFFYNPDFRRFSSFSDLYESVSIRQDLFYSPNETINVAKLNTSTNIYESQMGIILVQTGKYSISFNSVHIDSNVPYYSENVDVNITNFSKNTPKTYYFIVEQ